MKRMLFYSEKSLGPNDIHSFVNKFLTRGEKKVFSDYKIRFAKNILEVYSEIYFEDKMEVNGLRFKKIAEDDFTPVNFKIGQEVNIEAMICYGRTLGKNKTKCPIRYSGIVDELGWKLLENKLGVRFIRETLNAKHITPFRVNDKILIKDAMTLNARVVIEDVESFKKLQTNNVCMRKSYGFGWVDISEELSNN